MAVASDAAALAALRWQWNAEHHPVAEPLDAFSGRFALWMQRHGHSHEALLAIEDDTPIAMAWLASTDRLPDPGTEGATVGEIQSVYLLPDLRSAGRGSELMRAAIDRAASRGMGSVSVRPGRRSLPFYKRLGFEGADALLNLSLNP